MLVYEQDHYCVEEGLIIWIIWVFFFKWPESLLNKGAMGYLVL